MLKFHCPKCCPLYPPTSTRLIKPAGLEPRVYDLCTQSACLVDVKSYRYLLATSTFTPLYGRLCNVLGRRGANQTAVFFAALGTLACGFSTNMEMLIAARFVRIQTSIVYTVLTALQLAGLGGGGIFTTAT